MLFVQRSGGHEQCEDNSKMSYDRAITIFSPDGHLFQVEYAMEAVKKGAAVVGVRTKDSVILAVERRTTAKLQDSRSVRKLIQLDEHITLAFAGLNADARVLIDKARVFCQSYRLQQEVAPSVEMVARYIAGVQQQYTQRGGRRPFGIATFLSGFSESHGASSATTPQLWQTDPSGSYTNWKANATGRSAKANREFLEKHYKEGMDTPQGLRLAIMTLMEVVESGAKNIEVAVLSADGQLGKPSEEEIDTIIKAIEKAREEDVEDSEEEKVGDEGED